MGNYRQHLTFGSATGVAYGLGAFFFGQIHWIYGAVAAMLATLGGLLPDIDSDSGVEMRGFTGMMGVLVAITVWHRLAVLDPPPAFEYHLIAVVVSYVLVRHFLRRVAAVLTVHRGMSHSLPTCALWGAIALKYYPSDQPIIRVMMAVGLMAGFLSHLLLDELCSVDLRGARVNKAFGTAMKFWARSIWSTMAVYAVLSYLSYQLIQEWPDEPLNFGVKVDAPMWPFRVTSGSAARAEPEFTEADEAPGGPAREAPAGSRRAPAWPAPGRMRQGDRADDAELEPARIGAAEHGRSRIIGKIRPFGGRPEVRE